MKGGRSYHAPFAEEARGRRVALVVGDTEGHLRPALAVADAWRQSFGDADILFLGPGAPGAERLVTSCGYAYVAVPASPLLRVGLRARLRAGVRVLAGVRAARAALAAHRSRLVVGFGSYASGAVLLAARSLRLATAIHEANVKPGLANRLLAPLVDRTWVAFPEAGARLRARRLVVTGLPVRAAVAAVGERPRAFRAPAPRRVLVMSASRGGAFFARAVPDLLARLAATGVAVEVRHQTGEAPADEVRERYAAAGIPAEVSSHLEDVAACYAWADVAIARSGAGTVTELAAAAVPSLLVPLPDASEDHQAHNARLLAEAGGGLWTREERWDAGETARALAVLLSDPAAWTLASGRARQAFRPGAAQRIVDEGEAALHG